MKYRTFLFLLVALLSVAGCAQTGVVEAEVVEAEAVEAEAVEAEVVEAEVVEAGVVQTAEALPPGKKYIVKLGQGRINTVCVISNASYTNYAYVADADPTSNYSDEGFGNGEHRRIFSAMHTFKTNEAEIWAMDQQRTKYLPMKINRGINANIYVNTCGWKDIPFGYTVFGFEDAGGQYTSYDDVMIIFANVVP